MCDVKKTFVFYCFMQLYYEPYQGYGDDTAVNGMAAMCQGPAMYGTLTEIIEQNIVFVTLVTLSGAAGALPVLQELLSVP